MLQTPVARLIARGKEQPLRLEEVEALFASGAFVIDACRHAVSDGRNVISLATRPVLFALARALGEAWKDDVPRDALIARVFRLKLADESQRARLRVEMARLRAVLRPIAAINATERGFVLAPRGAREVVVLARPIEEKHAGVVLAFLSDGESWSTSALARSGCERASGLCSGRSIRLAEAGKSAVIGARPRSPLAGTPRAGIRDESVTPTSPSHRLG